MAINDQSFVGRDDELSAFRRLLKNRYGKIRIPFILGGGGIGKAFRSKE